MIKFTRDASGFTLDINLIPKCVITHEYSKWCKPYAIATNQAEQTRICSDCGKAQVRYVYMHTNSAPSTNSDVEHLQFIYDRLNNVYFEDESIVYMIKLKSIIDERSL